jgi:hypothetical protein
MKPYTLTVLVCIALAPPIKADHTSASIRPITDAESVLAAYHEDWGLNSAGDPAIIFVAWPDGSIVWSLDRINGGPPYRTGKVDTTKVSALLKRFKSDGLLANKNLNRAYFGADSQFTTVYIKSGENQVKMQSWHELFEADGKLVADDAGIRSVEGQDRLGILKKASAEYLFFRFVWSETRGKINELIPCESKATSGKPIMYGGRLSWQGDEITKDSNAAVKTPSK